MLKRIARWILTMVDVDVKLDGDTLEVTIELAGVQIAQWTIDLLKTPDEVTRGKHIHWRKHA